MDLLLWTDVPLPLETVRLAAALAGTAIGAYYDVWNNKNVPNTFLYGFLAIAFLVNLAAYDPVTTPYGIAAGAVIFAATWLLYKGGQLGGADVFILSSIAVLLPVQPSALLLVPPSLAPSLPFILSVIIASGLSFMLYMFVRSLPVALRAVQKPGMIGATQWVAGVVILAAYGIFATLAAQSGLMGPGYFALLTAVVAATLYFTLFKNALNDSMVEMVPLSKVEEEDILALDKADPALVKKYGLSRLVDAAALSRLKGYKGKLPVYKKLPAFLPHLLIGLLVSVLLGNIVLYFSGSPGALVF
ncbi:MAG: hypothetical protein KGH63_02120 [Candidatus Micrarchaeota archaeon]|nr:hypothetical protein [Candidatus Micrarchaeota archaeon]